MLESVKWGAFKIGDLFEVDNWVYGKNKMYKSALDVSTKKSVAVISGITENNGVNYYTEDDNLLDSEIFEKELTISTRGEYSGTVFYHNEKFVLANNILVMIMPNLSIKQKIFIGSIINFLPYGGYSGYPRKETLKNDIIQLPICEDGTINFSFMEKFIAELEATHLAELEAYLNITGLKDYELTSEEKQVLEDFKNDKLIWKEFKLADEIFNVKNGGNILSRDVKENSGYTPYLCASANNNSVSSYISYDEKYLDEGNAIFIGGKTFAVSYQEKDFYSNDSHNLVLYLKNEKYRDKLSQLYLATCVNRSLEHKYSWGNSISSKKIKKDTILLPVINEKPNYNIMSIFIKAIQKIVIKDVVIYSNEKMQLTKQVIEKNR